LFPSLFTAACGDHLRDLVLIIRVRLLHRKTAITAMKTVQEPDQDTSTHGTGTEWFGVSISPEVVAAEGPEQQKRPTPWAPRTGSLVRLCFLKFHHARVLFDALALPIVGLDVLAGADATTTKRECVWRWFRLRWGLSWKSRSFAYPVTSIKIYHSKLWRS